MWAWGADAAAPFAARVIAAYVDKQRRLNHNLIGATSGELSAARLSTAPGSIPPPPFEEVISRRPCNRQPYDGYLRILVGWTLAKPNLRARIFESKWR
jgi:hypothetical protein